MNRLHLPHPGVALGFRARNTLLAVVLVAVGAALVGIYVTSYRHSVEHGATMTKVYVAARDIPAGTSGAALGNYLRTEVIPRRAVVPGAISKPSELSAEVSMSTIVTGEQLSVRQFTTSNQEGALADLTGTQRAMLVPGDANQVLAGLAQAGDHVDVVSNVHYVLRITANGTNDLNRIASRVVLRNLRVLEAPKKSDDAAEASHPWSITLALSDSQVQKLFFAMKNGDWALTLRPSASSADSPDSIETINSILTDGLKARQLVQLYDGATQGAINGQ